VVLENHGQGLRTLYLHCGDFKGKAGQRVEDGEGK